MSLKWLVHYSGTAGTWNVFITLLKLTTADWMHLNIKKLKPYKTQSSELKNVNSISSPTLANHFTITGSNISL